MSFAVWSSKPPFEFAAHEREQIFQVGDLWVVTDDRARATQAEIDALLVKAGRKPTVQERLALVGLTVAELKAELSK